MAWCMPVTAVAVLSSAAVLVRTRAPASCSRNWTGAVSAAVLVVAVLIGLLLGHLIPLIIIGLFLSAAVGMALFGRRAQKARTFASLKRS